MKSKRGKKKSLKRAGETRKIRLEQETKRTALETAPEEKAAVSKGETEEKEAAQAAETEKRAAAEAKAEEKKAEVPEAKAEKKKTEAAEGKAEEEITVMPEAEPQKEEAAAPGAKPENAEQTCREEADREAQERARAEEEFDARLARHKDELQWLYCELYEGGQPWFDQLCRDLKNIALDRKESLRCQDRKREADPNWYKSNDILGMMMYVDCFAGNLQGVREKLDYVEECGVNYLHLMPLLESPEGRSDGGYAVSNFRRVQPELGTMEDLEQLANECRERGISLCLDFVMNHTSEDHEWARRARAGEREYMNRYYFYDNYDVPAEFEKTVPQVFPTTAPGNFTWLPDMNKFVMTTFYPYQWDLNYWNPVVLNEMIYNMLNLTNKGIDVIRIDAVPYIWKELGTSCRNLPQVHTIVRMMRMIAEIVSPATVLLGEVVMEPEKVVPYFGTVEKPE